MMKNHDFRPDDRDLAILKEIRKNPHVSAPEIAAAVKIPLPTVRKRIQRLLSVELLEREQVLRPGGPQEIYRIDVFINARALYHTPIQKHYPDLKLSPQEDLALYILHLLDEDVFRGRLVCDDVALFLGHRADLCVTLRAKDSEAIRDFVTGEKGLRRLPEIQNTNTARQVWSAAAYDEESPKPKILPSKLKRSKAKKL